MSELICEKTSGKDIDDIRSVLPFPSMIILCGAISAKYRVNVSDEFDYQWSINSVIRDSGGSGSNPGLVLAFSISREFTQCNVPITN